MPALSNKIALVAGATRGAGRGVARALGEAGAVVYCTGRSTGGAASDLGRSETIEETAALVDAMGGTGVPVPVDHTNEDAVRELVDRIRAEHGRLDVLVHSIWGGDAITQWGKRFWEVDVPTGLKMLERAVHTHVITARHAVPLMLESGDRGLVVELTDGAFAGYRGELFYDLCKASAIRLAYAMSVELDAHPITAVAVSPGFMRSEAVLDHFGVSEENWRDAIAKDPHFAQSETPLLVGRTVAALAADPDASRWAGRAVGSWDLSRHYGVDDADGARPHWDEYLDGVVDGILDSDEPSADDLMLLGFRGPQIDFDAARATQRERIRAFLAKHAPK